MTGSVRCDDRLRADVIGTLRPRGRRLAAPSAWSRRIGAAARGGVPGRLGPSTQRGCGSVTGGNALAEDAPWATLERVIATAIRAFAAP
jgi:hypothetical protein